MSLMVTCSIGDERSGEIDRRICNEQTQLSAAANSQPSPPCLLDATLPQNHHRPFQDRQSLKTNSRPVLNLHLHPQSRLEQPLWMRCFLPPRDCLYRQHFSLRRTEQAITTASFCVNTWLKEFFKEINCGLEG